MSGATVPVAAVDEESDALAREHHISAATQPGHRLDVDAVPQPGTVERGADEQLWQHGRAQVLLVHSGAVVGDDDPVDGLIVANEADQHVMSTGINRIVDQVGRAHLSTGRQVADPPANRPASPDG